MKTRERIKSVAIEMFNEKGASNVSTVQLANRLKMSPGNLYYHFENKEHIIRAIWEEEFSQEVHELFFDEEVGRTEKGILNFFNAFAEYVNNYMFFYAEFYIIMKNDPILCEKYRERYKNLMSRMMELMDAAEAQGFIIPLSDERKVAKADNFWTVGTAWIGLCKATRVNIPHEDIIKMHVLQLYSILDSMLTPETRDTMRALMVKKGYDASIIQKYKVTL